MRSRTSRTIRTCPTTVAEHYRLCQARLDGEAAWARQLLDRLHAGEYWFAEEPDPPWHGMPPGIGGVTAAASSSAERTRALARLAVELGANVAPGQDVVVLAWDVEHAPLARAIADVAYQVGAHYVSVLYWDQHVKRSRLEHADPDSLGYTPVWWDRHIEECIERRSASILVFGDPNPDLLSDIDPARTGRDSMPLTGPLHAMHAERRGELDRRAGGLERHRAPRARHRRRRRAVGGVRADPPPRRRRSGASLARSCRPPARRVPRR